MKVEGSCHCGAVRFEAEINPGRVSICHCTDCQALTGTAFRVSVPAAEADFKLLAGKPRLYLKQAESGAMREQFFCGDCGSPLWTAEAGTKPKTIGIRVGALRQRAELSPRRQNWHRSALPWVAGRFPEMPAADTEG